MEEKGTVFEPNGNDLRKVMFYYGVDFSDTQICCPFHDDDTPSMHVDYDEGTFHCFGCEVSGDALEFVKLASPRLNDLKSLIKYFRILRSKKVNSVKNLRIYESKNKKSMSSERKQELYDLAYDYYHGLSRTVWKSVDKDVRKYMQQRGFTSDILTKVGAKHNEVNVQYPIIFPIYDNDNFRGYISRTMNKNIEKRAKYNYNEGFQRNDTLGGNYNNKVVVLTEGYLDKIKMNQHGLKNVAAIFGWKVTKQQIEKLRKAGVKYVISALDNDAKGKDGTDYLKNFFEVIEFQFPKGVKDPGDLTKEQFDIAYKKTRKLLYSVIEKEKK